MYVGHMTYLHPFLRLVASGTLHNGEEQFSFSMAFISRDGQPDPVPPAAVPQSWITAFSTYWGATGVVSNAAVLRTLKLNQIGPDGRYTQDDTVEYDYPGTAPVGPVLPNYPPQVAIAISLRTDAARGRAHAGRFYLPSPAASLQPSTGTIGVSAQTTLQGHTKTLLDALNAGLSGYRLGVVSKVGSGAERPVTHIAVGAALDTIRSRRTDIPEAYTEAALAPLS